MKTIRIPGLILSLSLLVFSACGPDLEDCATKAVVFEGAWIIKEVYIDDQRQEPTSYRAYRLLLKPDATYERTQPAGFPDSGDWSLTSSETVLSLDPLLSPETENYVIESFNLRQLVLVLNRNSSKAGPTKIRYVLVPESEEL
ncbi:MAG TPA: hypothetical protein VFE50_25760 [Cyclobacteriaceae bacterium]|nr:hypothetical protein [Cyclobacteriaceae bacterium]